MLSNQFRFAHLHVQMSIQLEIASIDDRIFARKYLFNYFPFAEMIFIVNR